MLLALGFLFFLVDVIQQGDGFFQIIPLGLIGRGQFICLVQAIQLGLYRTAGGEIRQCLVIGHGKADCAQPEQGKKPACSDEATCVTGQGEE